MASNLSILVSPGEGTHVSCVGLRKLHGSSGIAWVSDDASFRWVPPWGQWRYFCYQWGTTVGSVVVLLLLGRRRGVSGGALL